MAVQPIFKKKITKYDTSSPNYKPAPKPEEVEVSGNVQEDGMGPYGSGEVKDFEIITVDIVAQPSAPGAYPTPIYEHLLNQRGGYKALNMARQ